MIHDSILTDDQFDTMIAHVLRAGVLVSAGIVLAGAVVFLTKYGLTAPEYGVFRGEPEDLRSVSGIVVSAMHLSGRGLIQVGLLTLIATPIARVVFAVVGFLKQRDWLYASLSMIVLILLTYSLRTG
jgi:uncharacterized membrane protein